MCDLRDAGTIGGVVGVWPVTSASPMCSETFSFILTDIEGARRYGYCRRLLVSGCGQWEGVCASVY